VDVLHKDALVLEHVTLGFLVQDVVANSSISQVVERRNGHHAQMLVNLASLSVLPQQPPQNSLSPHPEYLCGHAGLSSTLPFTSTGVATLSLSSSEVVCAGAGVDNGGLDNNTTLLDELLHMGTRVGVGDLGLLSGIEPDFALSDAGDAGGETFLRSKIDYSKSVYSRKTDRTGSCAPILSAVCRKKSSASYTQKQSKSEIGSEI